MLATRRLYFGVSPDPQGLRAGDEALWDIDEHVAAAPAGREPAAAVPEPFPAPPLGENDAAGDSASG